MSIKQIEILSRSDFNDAIVRLRLNVSEVAKELGIPRSYLSEFRNGDRQLRPEQLGKLRDFFESKGVEFTNEETKAAQPSATEQQTAPQAIVLPMIVADEGLTYRTALVCRHFFIDERITDEQIVEAGERIQESFAQAKNLLDVDLVKSWGNYDEATESGLRELWGHLARIGLVSLHLQGRILIDQDRILAGAVPEGNRPEPKTLGDLLANAYREAVAGLTTDGPSTEIEPQPEEVEEEEEAA